MDLESYFNTMHSDGTRNLAKVTKMEAVKVGTEKPSLPIVTSNILQFHKDNLERFAVFKML